MFVKTEYRDFDNVDYTRIKIPTNGGPDGLKQFLSRQIIRRLKAEGNITRKAAKTFRIKEITLCRKKTYPAVGYNPDPFSAFLYWNEYIEVKFKFVKNNFYKWSDPPECPMLGVEHFCFPKINYNETITIPSLTVLSAPDGEILNVYISRIFKKLIKQETSRYYNYFKNKKANCGVGRGYY